jgi:hypothetical protein
MNDFSSRIDLRGLTTFLNIHKPFLQKEHEANECVINVLQYMLRFSFSNKLNTNLNWVQLILLLPPFVAHYIDTSNASVITMKNILKAVSKLIGVKVFRINRKMEELLSLECAITMMFMKSKYCGNINFAMDQFLFRYPAFNSPSISNDERLKLLEFCNCTRVIQCLIPPHNNKEHILDLVSRLTEGYSVRYVTGTGMTEETARRYEIIHIEGDLRIRHRSFNKKQTDASNSALDQSSTVDAVEVNSDSSFSSSSDEEDLSSSSSSSDNERKRSRDDNFSPSCKKNKIDAATEDDARDGLLLLLQANEAI